MTSTPSPSPWPLPGPRTVSLPQTNPTAPKEMQASLPSPLPATSKTRLPAYFQIPLSSSLQTPLSLCAPQLSVRPIRIPSPLRGFLEYYVSTELSSPELQSICYVGLTKSTNYRICLLLAVSPFKQ